MTTITTLRIPSGMEKRIRSACSARHLTKSKLFREAIEFYLDKKVPHPVITSEVDSRFGKYGSGTKNRSTEYKSILKAKLREKNAR